MNKLNRRPEANNVKLITIAEAAKMLTCSPSKIYALERAGLLELKKIGYRATRVSEPSVQRLIAEAHTPIVPTILHQRLRVPQAAKYLGVSTNSLYHMRSNGDGPPFIKIGGTILYDTRALDSWLEARTHQSIAESRMAEAGE